MKTSCIRHPKNSNFIMRRDWQLEACKNPDSSGKDSLAETCAELLAILEFHQNNRYANEILKGLIEQAMKKHGKKPLRSFGEWMPYSTRYLHELLLGGRGRNQIMDALKHLEKIGFISSDCPADITKFYSDNMNWYMLLVDNINRWIDENIEKPIWVNEQEPVFEDADSLNKEIEQPKSPAELVEKPADKINKLIKAIFRFDKHIHSRTANYIYDVEREKMLRARLKEGRTLAQCCQAIIGNTLSEWHTANSPKNDKANGGTVYNSVEYYFQTAKRFENHLRYSEEAGVTEQIALSEFEGFIIGIPSRYSQKQKNAARTQANASSGDIKSVRELSKEESARYSLFARKISVFFKDSNYPLKDILEIALSEEFEAETVGLTDAEFLAELIVEKMKIFSPRLDEKVRVLIEQFANDFCETVRLNMED